jgi:hypothetical protein
VASGRGRQCVTAGRPVQASSRMLDGENERETMSRKRSPKETLEATDRPGDSREAAPILAPGDDERAHEAERSERRRTTVRPRRRERQNVLWLAAAAVAAAYLLFLVVPRLSPATPVLTSRPPPPSASDRDHPTRSDLERASALRRVALDACAVQRWRACLEGLDDARRIDPEGESEPTVRAARDRATLDLRQRPQDGSP